MRNGAMNMDMLEEFAYLSDTLSFKKTAEHFFVSKSVISRHVAALEEMLGVRLLERDSRGARLTEAGSEFSREAKIVLRDWDAAVERARESAGSYSTTVRIGYLRNAARPVIVRFVRYMTSQHPELRLSLVCMEYVELRRALEDHEVDVAIAMSIDPALSKSYRSTSIYEDSFSAVCANDHPLAARKEGVTLEDLRSSKLLLPDIYVYGGLAEFIDRFVDEKDLQAAQAYYRDIDMLYLKVQTEGYVAFSSGMNNMMFGNQLTQLPVVGADVSFSTVAYYHDEFIGAPLDACREGFECSARALADWQPEIKYEFFGQ